ncbi:MAG: ATP-binding protein, partial [Ignavibacteria bacterium]|nr:ATP-binding protein [Ignavibacteria bacterium]
FACAILFNNNAIYFLPNITESVVFVALLSMVSIIACAYNFKIKVIVAEKNFKIRYSEKKYRLMFDNAVEGMFQSTLEGKFLNTNKAFADILGYNNKDELKEIDVTELYVNHGDRKELINELRKKSYVKDYQVELKKKDGSSVLVSLNNRLLKGEDGNQFIEGNMQDITEHVFLEQEREKVEDALRKEKEKSETLAKEAMRLTGLKSKFLANMSHEIRTPMNGILGYLTLIEAGAHQDEEELKQFTSNARQCAESLMEIINSILDLSKIESGKIELEKLDFDLYAIIDQAISVISAQVTEKKIEIIRDIPEDTIHLLNGDPTKLRQIFLNLLSNAVKFTLQGEVKILARTERIDEGTINLDVKIIDSGIGIPAEKINSLFIPFSQIDGSEIQTMKGTGLGLVICKEFVSLMGGSINVTSEQNKGSSFNFNVRLKVQSNTDQLNEIQDDSTEILELEDLAEIEDSKKAARAQFNILLAEDNLTNQKVSLKILHASGYKASPVSNGKEALKEVKEGDFDLVLMDIQMPEVDGFSATTQIRSLNSDKKDIPIIALTAHALIGDREKCIKAGMNDYLSKPIIAKELLTMIDRLLNINDVHIPEKPTEEQTENSLFDFNRLKKVSADDFDFEKDLLSSYVVDVKEKCEQLDELLITKDFQQIINLAHTIKGASYTVGAQKVGDEAFGIEISAKSNDLLSVRDRLPQLKTALEETKEVLSGFLVT